MFGGERKLNEEPSGGDTERRPVSLTSSVKYHAVEQDGYEDVEKDQNANRKDVAETPCMFEQHILHGESEVQSVMKEYSTVRIQAIVRGILFRKRFRNRKQCHVCEELATLCCSGCSKVYYCCKECQLRHWPVHKVSCAAFQNKHIRRPRKGSELTNNADEWLEILDREGRVAAHTALQGKRSKSDGTVAHDGMAADPTNFVSPAVVGKEALTWVFDERWENQEPWEHCAHIPTFCPYSCVNQPSCKLCLCLSLPPVACYYCCFSPYESATDEIARTILRLPRRSCCEPCVAKSLYGSNYYRSIQKAPVLAVHMAYNMQLPFADGRQVHPKELAALLTAPRWNFQALQTVRRLERTEAGKNRALFNDVTVSTTLDAYTSKGKAGAPINSDDDILSAVVNYKFLGLVMSSSRAYCTCTGCPLCYHARACCCEFYVRCRILWCGF